MNTTKPPANKPATRLLPPLPFALALLAGWLLHHYVRALPMPAALQWLGFALLAAGGGLMAWAAYTFWRHKTTISPFHAASTLCTGGPFAFSRNPIYVGDWLLLVGGALAMQSWWPLVFAPLIAWVFHRFVIVPEEAHLRAAFGSAYAAYCQKVRRWL